MTIANKTKNMDTIFPLFEILVKSIKDGVLIKRESNKDKEFHFQNWVRDRFKSSAFLFEEAGRNSFPDFRLVEYTDGYEVKGLAYPGRWKSYDSNSQVPTGLHNGRTIYYVFGRYPKQPDGDMYPLVDLVICHGDFLNADHTYIHENKAVREFGSYGDILIRDRKMYVAPTPFGLLTGVAHRYTLIIPEDSSAPDGFIEVGQIVRKEVNTLISKYEFDLRSNELKTDGISNPNAGKEHSFRALRLVGEPIDKVTLNKAKSDEFNQTEPID